MMNNKVQRIVKKNKYKVTYELNGHEFTVDRRYIPTHLVGCGAYGIVCAGKRLPNNKKVAIKKINNVFEDIVDGKRILREILLLKHFRHANIMSINDIFKIHPKRYNSFKEIYIVSELMDTDLYRVIKSSNLITEDHRKYFIYQILKGLKYIHSGSVIHRDLKPSNILVNVDCHLSICDFGLARGVNPEYPGKTMTEYVVTRWYRAPELLLMCDNYTSAIDIWSVGCILAELINRRPLFPGENYIEQMKMVIRVLGKPSPEDTSHITADDCLSFIKNIPNREPVNLIKLCPKASKQELDILQKTLVFNPAKRITAAKLLEHPYFKKLHDSGKEKKCAKKFKFKYDYQDIDEKTLRASLYREMLHFHPELQQQFQNNFS